MHCMLFSFFHIGLDQTTQYHAKLYLSIFETLRDGNTCRFNLIYYTITADDKGKNKHSHGYHIKKSILKLDSFIPPRPRNDHHRPP